MRIAGLQKFSLIDYPGKIAAIVFTQGCYFRCPYCHNPELVLPGQFGPLLETDTVLDFFRSRIGKLDGIVITGGEPTMQGDLAVFIQKVKEMGFLVKLDTSGVRPDVLSQLLKKKLLDYVAMDIKAPLSLYESVTRVPVKVADLRRSIALLLQAEVGYEFRTTLVEGLLSPREVLAIGGDIRGAKQYYLQRFVSTKAVDQDYLGRLSFSDEALALLQQQLLTCVEAVGIR